MMSYPRILYHVAYVLTCSIVTGTFYHYARVYTRYPHFSPDFLPRLYAIKEVAVRFLGIVLAVSVGFIFVGPFAMIPMFIHGAFFSTSISLEQVVALLLVAYLSAFVGNHHERERVRKLLQSERDVGEQLYQTSHRLMVEQKLDEELSDTVNRLKYKRLRDYL